MSLDTDWDTEISLFEWKKRRRVSLELEKKELSVLPKAILVTFTGSGQSFNHTGRSRFSKRNPYSFHKDRPLKITEPADIKYFMNYAEKNPTFHAEILDEEGEIKFDAKLETKIKADKLAQKKAEIDAIKKIEDDALAVSQKEEKEELAEMDRIRIDTEKIQAEIEAEEKATAERIVKEKVPSSALEKARAAKAKVIAKKKAVEEAVEEAKALAEAEALAELGDE